jgi:hypothetical protein
MTLAAQQEQACTAAGAAAENLLTSGKFYVWDGFYGGETGLLGQTGITLYSNTSGDTAYVADYMAIASWHLLGSDFEGIAETFYHQGGHASDPETDYWDHQQYPTGISPWHQSVYALGTFCASAAPFDPGVNP